MDKIFDEIVKHDIISFDIFDTLLIRPFARAKDIFKFIELNENATGFAISREKAEIEARVKNPKDEDVTIDEIYNFIEEKFKRVKTKEIEIEEQILQVNSKIKEYFDFALSLGKKIVLVSDSYLTKDILEIILNRRGYSGYNKIYISSEYRKTKHSGKLFQVVQEDLKTKNILHIGDNKYSDYTVPKNLGWDAICIKKPVDIYLDHDSRAKNLYNKQSDNLEISILFGILAIYYINKSNNYWKDFGFKYAGPAIYAYTSWIYREACKDNIENILFISQESYSLRKVFEILYPDKHFNTQYVYVPQGLDALINLDLTPYLFSNQNEALATVRKIINYYKDKNSLLYDNAPTQIKNVRQGLNFINKYKNIFDKLVSIKRDDYKNYLYKVIGESKKIAMVETSPIYFSKQKIF